MSNQDKPGHEKRKPHKPHDDDELDKREERREKKHALRVVRRRSQKTGHAHSLEDVKES